MGIGTVRWGRRKLGKVLNDLVKLYGDDVCLRLQ